jgi:heparin binding hemagglutinin HbhA
VPLHGNNKEAVMALMTDIRKNVTESTPVMAVVGATDYAVERVRVAAANAGHLHDEVEKTFAALETVPATLQARVKKLDAKSVQQMPALAVARALEAAGKVEEFYEQLAARGKKLIDRVTHQKATQDLLAQGKVTVSRTKAAVTTARKAVDETTSAALGVVHLGRQEAGEAVAEVEKSVAATEKVVAARTRRTRVAAQEAAKEAGTTARKRAVSTRSAVKGAATSARKTAESAVEAVEETVEKIGDKVDE